jgi:DeoR/GlpR family transcriptional regulator of sugar metabolism
MLTAERRTYILNQLKRDGRVLAKSLSEELNTSEDTIRRDLRELAAEGLLQRVHGGALPRSPAETSYANRQRALSPAKVAIAHKAAALIQPGMVVFLGGGTTNTQLAAALPPTLQATIITHNPAAAAALADHPGVEVILVGGRLDKYSLVTIGADTVETLQRMRADLCMLGVCSLHPENGVTNNNLEESYVQRVMIANAAEVVALASAEKLGTVTHFLVAPIQDLAAILTDADVPDEVVAPYQALGIEVIR